MSSGAEALLHHRQAASYRQAAILQTHSWQRPILGGSPVSSSRGGSIQSATFDSQGELLAAVSDEGILTVHSSAALQAAAMGCCAAAGGAAALPPPAAQPTGAADPLLVLDTHMAKLQAVRWNPADENIVGVASAATRQLVLYDLLHTQVRWRACTEQHACTEPLLLFLNACLHCLLARQVLLAVWPT